MNRSTTLLIALCATASIMFLASCGNGPQNTNTSANGGGRQDNNSNTNANVNALPSPVTTPTTTGPSTPDPTASVCDPSVAPATRATNVENWLSDKITQEGAFRDLKQLRDNNKFKLKVAVFPPPSGGSSDTLVLALGGMIEGKNVFQELNVLTQPVVGRKCVMAVALVPYSKADVSIFAWSPDDGMVWTGCDYPAVACPDGTCATSCSGGIGGILMAKMANANANSGNGGNANSKPSSNTKKP